MILLERFDPKRIVQLLPETTVFMGVPTFYTRLLATPELNADVCQHMRLFISGSAPLLEHTFTEFQRRTGHTILERYGMTETGMNTSNPLSGARIAGTVGPPLPGVLARVVNSAGETLSAGEVGELQVKGPNVFTGYWDLPDKTAEEFSADGYFKTGDLARIDHNGYVAIVGRTKDMVISGGYNVYPKEIEHLIDAIEGVAESAVIGIPHPDFGEGVTAVVVRRHDTGPPDEAEILRSLREELAGYKVPKRVLFVSELPRNTMGKVQKNVLREQFAEIYSRAQP
jgi:malonyl-CoA/methylmalonyl-CoA synthetase